jgi:hypothetical protein
VTITVKIAAALVEAHQAGILHRQGYRVSPSNYLAERLLTIFVRAASSRRQQVSNSWSSSRVCAARGDHLSPRDLPVHVVGSAINEIPRPSPHRLTSRTGHAP